MVPCVRKRILKIQPDGDGLSNAGLPIDQARDGGLRKGTKATLLHKLAVFVDRCNQPSIQIIDGNEMLYHVSWPKTGTVKHLLQNFLTATTKEFPVCVIFDRYVEGSIKTQERKRRADGKKYPQLHLTLETSLPGKETILKSTENKKELIKVFCASEQTANIQLIGEENSVYKHEEADCNIIRYVEQFIHEGKKHTDDTG